MPEPLNHSPTLALALITDPDRPGILIAQIEETTAPIPLNQIDALIEALQQIKKRTPRYV